jgi:hypothetical protein
MPCQASGTLVLRKIFLELQPVQCSEPIDVSARRECRASWVLTTTDRKPDSKIARSPASHFQQSRYSG